MATKHYLQIPVRNPSSNRGYHINYHYNILSPSKPNPIVLISGWTGCKENWNNFATELAKSRMVIVPDHRGIGESQIIFHPNHPLHLQPAKMPLFNLSDLASDIATLVVQVCGTRKVDIMGHSMGGMIAQQFALDYPQMVSNLILCSTSPAGGRNVPFIKQITKNWFKAQSKMGMVSDPQRLRKLATESMLFSLGPLYVQSERNMRKIDEYLNLSMSLNKPMETSMAQLTAISNWNGIPRLKELNQFANQCGFKIVVIHGDQDNVCDVRNAQYLHDRLPVSQLYVMAGVGHLITFDDAAKKKVIQILDDLRRVRAVASVKGKL